MKLDQVPQLDCRPVMRILTSGSNRHCQAETIFPQISVFFMIYLLKSDKMGCTFFVPGTPLTLSFLDEKTKTNSKQRHDNTLSVFLIPFLCALIFAGLYFIVCIHLIPLPFQPICVSIAASKRGRGTALETWTLSYLKNSLRFDT